MILQSSLTWVVLTTGEILTQNEKANSNVLCVTKLQKIVQKRMTKLLKNQITTVFVEQPLALPGSANTSRWNNKIYLYFNLTQNEKTNSNVWRVTKLQKIVQKRMTKLLKNQITTVFEEQPLALPGSANTSRWNNKIYLYFNLLIQNKYVAKCAHISRTVSAFSISPEPPESLGTLSVSDKALGGSKRTVGIFSLLWLLAKLSRTKSRTKESMDCWRKNYCR